ncbi:endoglycosidase [Lactococcus formosensis]|uniref:mannosyl-glycoprotein endo-beta-N-acetylglucosaminidase n=1 Tax=Lactococcus formosensis TaxID=1281486 RepID=A0A9X4SB81_9LACT|nr:endoglycosidase [Lactococcus formosensis]MDG6111960.1 endoglycosidase [Lactococcus formosensis]MDG6118137.1 endoglycosidase [Lactococcus formosensis]MDG6133126.1 endoglycosidase [Lactococcus formosensis]MDG6134989.1 endoglycosidase [Lactococcus formosensis]MDG6139131.1 endoglycosidase [Lactococcus formosensis]
MKKIKHYILGLLTVGLGMLIFGPISAQAQEDSQQAKTMVYYRAWRDKEMKGVNTSLTDENWLSMDDIPYGIDIVNVFSYVPQGQEEAAAPFFEKLKKSYVPNLHARGVKLTKAIDYSELLKIPYAGNFPTVEEFDAYANKLLDEHVRQYGLDGLDIDMETYPSTSDIALSNGVVRALSKYIGPLANNGTVFVYDTNGSNLNPLKDVADSFTYLGYQQYGSDETRTARAIKDYTGVIPKEQVMPGLAFPEEQDRNRWYDAKEPYEESNIYKVAKYTAENKLYGMFLYALDRDGRTYNNFDLNHIVPSNFLWTKTAILQAKGFSLQDSKDIALHHWKRVGQGKENYQVVLNQINQAQSIYDVNKVLLGSSDNFANDGISPQYDPMYELQLMK